LIDEEKKDFQTACPKRFAYAMQAGGHTAPRFPQLFLL
jgi:hypothetical protein